KQRILQRLLSPASARYERSDDRVLRRGGDGPAKARRPHRRLHSLECRARRVAVLAQVREYEMIGFSRQRCPCKPRRVTIAQMSNSARNPRLQKRRIWAVAEHIIIVVRFENQ